MQNRDLRTLRAVAALGGFTAAADHLNMTVSAVSMQMKALEASLHVQLFDRRVRPPRLTPIGRSVARAGEAVLLAEARLRALAGSSTLAGRFRIGIVSSVSPRLLPRFLMAAPVALPQASFTFRTGLSEALEKEVGTGALDAAIVTTTGIPGDGLSYLLLTEDRLARAARPGLPADAPFLHFAPSTGIGRLIAVALASHPDLATAPRIVLDHVETIRACLLAGAGSSMLPLCDLAGLGPVAIAPIAASRRLVLVTREGSVLASRMTILQSLLIGEEAARTMSLERRS